MFLRCEWVHSLILFFVRCCMWCEMREVLDEIGVNVLCLNVFVVWFSGG